MLAGLAEPIPWLNQWHNEATADFGRLRDFFETFLDSQLHAHGLTRQDLVEFPPVVRRRGRKEASV